MDTEDIFGAADGILDRMEAALAAATEASAGIPGIVASVLGGGILPSDGAREIKALAAHEAEALAFLPRGMEELVRSLDGVKAHYAPSRPETTASAKPRKGLAAAFAWKRRPAVPAESREGFAAGMAAQAAYAGRIERMERGAAAIDRALGEIPARRKEADGLAFGVQELAVSMAGAAARDLYPVEDIVSALLARSDALGLHARLLSSVDRSGDEGPCLGARGPYGQVDGKPKPSSLVRRRLQP